MENLLEPPILREIFRGVDNLGGLQQYANRVRMLHHRYLEARLIGEQMPNIELDELLRFVEDADFLSTQYTNPLIVDEATGIPIEEVPSRQIVQDALTLAGTLYEFLSDIVALYEDSALSDSDILNGEGLFRRLQSDGNNPHTVSSRVGRSSLLNIKSALCYGLGRYESRIQVILGRMFKRRTRPGEKLLQSNLNQWADYLLCGLLARRLTGTELSDVIFNLNNATTSLRTQLRGALGQEINIPLRHVAQAEVALSLIDATLNYAQALEFGDESKFQEAQENLKKSTDAARVTGDYELIWVYRTLSKVMSRMWMDCPWQRLREVIPNVQYLRSLISDGIVTLWSSQIAAF